MFNRHNEVPVYTSFDARVEANYYNHVQVALKRLGAELRFKIPGLKTLDLILQNNAWIIVDRAFNDIPVVAWVDFQGRGREQLHEPVACTIRYFHANAALILRRSLEAMDQLLGAQLLLDTDDQHQVFAFKERQDGDN